jgi:replicative DNA helicase
MNLVTPPYSQESEMAVIGSLLEDCSLLGRIEFLSSDDFYMLPHRLIFNIFLEEHAKGNSFDLNLISDKITDDMGGTGYFVDIWKQKRSVANVVSYARKVVDLSIRRKSMAAYQKGIEDLANTNTNFVDEINKIAGEVDKSVCRLNQNDSLDVDTLIDQSVDEMEKSLLEVRTGISSGIPEVDERLGYQMLAIGEVTIVGAPSKNGKTLFANTIAARCDLLEGESAHIFSIEMPALGMFNGIVSAIAGVPSNFYVRQAYYSKALPGKYDEWMAKWGAAAQELREKSKITIDGRKDVTMQYICSEMRKQSQLAQNNGKKLRIVFIDHAHRISYDCSKKPMTYAMGDDVRMLKNTASDLGIAVVLLCQLNENSKDRDPTSYDILDTSRIRHEMQAFIGLRLFRESGGTYFGVYGHDPRYADHETKFHPAYMWMDNGVVKSLPEHNKHWTPSVTEQQ